MFNLEEAIKNWKKSVYKNPSLEEGYIEELESHLRDEIETLINSGMNEKEAFEKAKEEIGETEKILKQTQNILVENGPDKLRSGYPFWSGII